MTPRKSSKSADAPHPRPADVTLDVVTLRITLFESASTELRTYMTPPWPMWVEDLYTLHEFGSSVTNVKEGQASLSSAITALVGHMHHHLNLAALVIGSLEETGWHIGMHKDDVVCTLVGSTADKAREDLKKAGLWAPLLTLAMLGEDGLPLLAQRTGAAGHANG